MSFIVIHGCNYSASHAVGCLSLSRIIVILAGSAQCQSCNMAIQAWWSANSCYNCKLNYKFSESSLTVSAHTDKSNYFRCHKNLGN